MNKRNQLKEVLAKLDESCHHIFRRMYSYTDLTKDINLVVDSMTPADVSLGLEQANNSYYNLFKTIAKDYTSDNG